MNEKTKLEIAEKALEDIRACCISDHLWVNDVGHAKVEDQGVARRLLKFHSIVTNIQRDIMLIETENKTIESCGNCYFGRKATREEIELAEGVFYCHRNPHSGFEFPRVTKYQWCGRFKTREESKCSVKT